IFQMLTGRLPFEGDTPMRQMMAHVTEPPPDARTIRPDLPAGVGRVLVKAMAKEPADRYPNARSLASALRAAGGMTAFDDALTSEDSYNTMPVLPSARSTMEGP